MTCTRSTVRCGRPSPRGGVLAALGLLGVLGAILLAVAGGPRPDALAVGASADDTRAAVGVTAPPALAGRGRLVGAETAGPRAFMTGDVLRWAVVARSDVELAVGAPSDEAAAESAADRRIAVVLTGTLEARVYAADREGALVGFVLDGASLVSTASSVPAEAGVRAEPALAEEVLGQLGTDGRVLAVAFPSAVSEELRALWRDVLARWQVALPPTADAATWGADEFDSTGPYVAAYRRAPDQGPHAVEKRKVGVVAGLEVQGVARIRLRARAEEIVWGERAVLRPSGAFEARVQADFEGRASLVAERHDPALAAQAADRRALAERRGFAPLHGATSEAEGADLEPLPDAASAIAAVEEAWGGEGDVTALRVERLTALVRVLRASDAAVARVIDRLREAGLPEPVGAALAGALASAGTPATARALALVLSDAAVGLDARYASVVAVGLHAAPTRDVEAALRAVLEADRDGPLAGAALLARGSVAEVARVADPTWHDDVVRALAAEAAVATDTARLFVVMEAIGNAAPSTVPDVVRSAIASDDAERRASALRGLRNTRDGVALTLLRAAYATDADEAVRLGALEIALEDGHPLRCEALAHLEQQEASDFVRRTASAWAAGDGPCVGPVK